MNKTPEKTLKELTHELQHNTPDVIKQVIDLEISGQTSSLISTMNVITDHLLLEEDKTLIVKLLLMISLLPQQLPTEQLEKLWKLSREQADVHSILKKLHALNLIKLVSNEQN